MIWGGSRGLRTLEGTCGLVFAVVQRPEQQLRRRHEQEPQTVSPLLSRFRPRSQTGALGACSGLARGQLGAGCALLHGVNKYGALGSVFSGTCVNSEHDATKRGCSACDLFRAYSGGKALSVGGRSLSPPALQSPCVPASPL